MNADTGAQPSYTPSMRTRIDDFNPPPPDRDLKPTEKNLAVLDLFTRYELLPSHYLKVGAKVGWWPVRELKKYHYIGIPHMHGARTLDSRNRVRVLQILPRGKAMLNKPIFRSNDNSYEHKLLIALAQFSFDRAEHEIPGLKKVSLQEILEHDYAKAAREDPQPNAIPIGDYRLIPDADLFGYELNGRFLFIHGFEADRGTEVADGEPNTHHKKTIKSMVRYYGRYLRENIYWHRYGLKAVLIPFICDSEEAKTRIMNIVKRDIEPELWEFFVFKVVSTDPRNFPPPTAHLVTEDWQKADGSPFNILEVLNANRPQDTSETERAA